MIPVGRYSDSSRQRQQGRDLLGERGNVQRSVYALVAVLCASVLISVLGAASEPARAAPPTGFQETVAFSGLTNPMLIRFAADGRVFVAEKSGLIKVFDGLGDPTPSTFADLRTNVHNFWDRGLLGMALAPTFPADPSVYVLYTHDAAIGGVAPRWGTVGATDDGCPTPPGATGDGCVVSGRLSRLQANGNVAGPEQVLIEDWCQQYPSHSLGSLAFGADGALYVSAGDGSSFLFTDWGQDGTPVNPCADPPGGAGTALTPPTAEGGALRSQDVRTATDPTTLDGAILRLDPATGAALPDNPLAFSSDPNARRIIAHGFRNPFRFGIRPGTNEVWVGDVGWNDWEEIDLVQNASDGAADNYGWPCYEGAGRQSGYDSANLNLCESLYGQAGATVTPFFTYSHSTNVAPGDNCPVGSSSISGIAFETTSSFPSLYDGAMFFADYSRRCIWVMRAAANGRPDPATRQSFVTAAAGPVDVQFGPDGALFYADFDGGTIRRVAFTGSDTTPPTVSVTAPPSGATLTGTTSVTANASDNSGTVAGVQFRLDGIDLGAEDTSAPFSLGWDTRTATNGPHTLTAVARDPTGNTTTSTAVPVTVSNTGSPPPLGLVAAYGFDETGGTVAGDASGNGNTGTVSGAAWATGGRYGGALSFDGVNDWVTVAGAASLDLPTGMTLEAWVRPVALGGWRTVLLKEQTGFYTYALYADTGGGAPSGNAVAGGEDVDVRATVPLPLNAWTHLAATYDGAAVRLFVNGTEAAQLPAGGTIASGGGPLHIGGNAIWPEWFQGLIDEVRVYNRALSAAEIQSDITRPVTSTDSQPPSPPGTLSATGGLGSVSLTWGTASDDTGVVRYNVHRSTTAGFTPSAANRVAQPTGTSYLDSGLSAGTYYYRVTAEDAAGNVGAPSNESSGVATSDTTPPAVSITAPSAGATVSGAVTVNATASDAGTVADVQFKLDGANLGPEDTSAPYATNWDTTTASNGSHSLTATARDAAGNQATSAAVAVTVSNVTPTGLVAAYGFGEGAGTATADASGSGNNGTISGASWSTAGHAGNALSFDGVNDWVTVPDANSLDLTGGMTLEAWVFPTTLGNGWRTVVFKEQSGDLVYGMYANRPGTRPNGQVFVAGNDRHVNGTAALALNAWSHLATTYDGSFLRLWVNGTQVAQLAQTGPIATSTGALRLGGNNIWSEWFTGRLDDVRVYNRALTAGQLQTDMTTPVGGGGSPNTPPTVTISSPAVGTTWKVDDPINFSASATDVQDGTLPATAFDWTIFVQHCPSNCHTHTYQIFNDTSAGSFPAPDHEYPSHLELRVTATDSAGATTTVSRDILPQTVDLTFASSPPGLQLTVGPTAETTPFTRTVIVGSTNSVSATTPQALGGTTYDFSSWSNGGAQTHVVTAPASPVTYTATYVASVDANPPSAAVTAPAAGALLRGSVSVNATASDNVGVVGVQFRLDGQPLGPEDTSSPYGVAWDTVGTGNGAHALTAVARDAAGNSTTSTQVAVTVDNAAPSAAVTAPAAGATVSGTQTVSAAASDNVAVAGVQFLLDGSALGAEDTTSPYSVSWDTATTSNGAHTLTAVARDTAGNSATSPPVGVTVSNTLAAGLVAAYGFEEASGMTVTDSSGRGNTGTINGATRTTAGKNGRALSFDGVNDSVAVPDAASLDLTTGMTLEAWVFPTTAGTSWRTVLLKESPGFFVYGLYANEGTTRPSAHIVVGGADLDVRGAASSVPLNAWTHLAATYDGTTLRLFVNGVQVATRAVTGSMANSTGLLKIGGNAIWSEWLGGRLDDVRLYNRALTPVELQADMNRPAP